MQAVFFLPLVCFADLPKNALGEHCTYMELREVLERCCDEEGAWKNKDHSLRPMFFPQFIWRREMYSSIRT